MAFWIGALALFGLLACWLWRRAASGQHKQGPMEEEEEEQGGCHGRADFAVGDCQLICKPSALAQALLKSFRRCPDLEARCWAWKSWPNLQTAAQLLWPPAQALEFARDHLELADGGLVALDWVVGPWEPGSRRATSPGKAATVLLVVPNATGRLTRAVHQLCQMALQQGHWPVIFNRRGHNGCPLTNLRLQPFGQPADLKEAVAYIRSRHPATLLFAVSEGSGSGLLLSYLGECGSSSSLRGAACISPVLKCRDWLEGGIPWLYEQSLLLLQKRDISRYRKALREAVDMERVLRCGSLQEFEEALFCPQERGPATTWEAYWEHNDPLRDADKVAVPVLCLCSADDPIRGPPRDTLPWELFRSSPYFFLLLTPQGGHCGFLRKGSSPPSSSWGNAVALEYLRTLAKFFRSEERLCRRSSRVQHRRR
ncbi:protein ABHD15 [Hemicordylus capensis]|uniref:protein ABHD15 n=1 Tax=Hemicordylus capensis TaxID=884348 RepID=UPI002304A4D1|nr:protein ABHD15 [Hemicordylus capensis]